MPNLLPLKNDLYARIGLSLKILIKVKNVLLNTFACFDHNSFCEYKIHIVILLYPTLARNVPHAFVTKCHCYFFNCPYMGENNIL